jgi:hypothetical protein
MTMLMQLAISAYSIAVVPDSSRKKSDASFAMNRTAHSDRSCADSRALLGTGNLNANDCTDP